ncbi:MAG: DNA cytosine methyltransferase [Pseudomonadota bacterium]|nr:DNA cytosine methyltransferase [Pseudomonadota bacterium]
MRVLDLFSGIGGFSLGLERAGMRTVAFCEIEPFARRVLRKHWPEVPIYEDVRQLTADALRRDGIGVDLICGGFPCQDISFAGKGAGLAGERSGLWSEFARLIGELRPEFVIVENVAALLGRGLDRVLGDLATLGFDAEWHCIPAAAVGAPHRRDRVWIIAYPRGEQHEAGGAAIRRPGAEGLQQAALADAERVRASQSARGECQERMGPILGSEALADAYSHNRYGRRSDVQVGRVGLQGEAGHNGHSSRAEWLTEPDVGRVAHGVPARVDRLRGLGNAVVPQIPELIGRAIMGTRGPQAGQVPSGCEAPGSREGFPATIYQPSSLG